MDRNEFWGLIGSVNLKVDIDDQEAVLRATREALCELSSGEIAQWYEVYRELHNEAYRDDLWDAVAACGIHASDDGFIDFRAWLISRGQEVYEAVLADPRVLADYVPEPREANFELYGYVSVDAYSERMCRDLLGDVEFEAFKENWLIENKSDIEELADWNGSSIEEAGEKMFYSTLLMKHDIFKALDEKPLQDRLDEAKARSADVSDKVKDEEKGLFF